MHLINFASIILFSRQLTNCMLGNAVAHLFKV